VLEDLGDCRCRLHEQRKKIVFGVGNQRSPLVFVAKARARTRTSRASFVGRAGQLLTQMIEGTAKREGMEISGPTSTSRTW
jgi:DNA polymerase